MSDEPFYVAGDGVFQRPATVVGPDGVAVHHIGFPVCRVHPAMPSDLKPGAEERIAALLNAGHAALADK